MTILKNPKWTDIALLILLSLLPLLFFWRLITPNPADRMQIVGGDFSEQYFPLRAFTAQEWVNGRIPLWNPYLYGGQPALADIQSGGLYPPHLIEALLLGWGGPLFGQETGFPLWALELQAIAHFSLAAVGTYLFARHLGRRCGAPLRRARFGGVIASLVFTYGGYLTGFPVQQITILEASAWLPWVLWGLSVAEEQRSGGAEEQRSKGAREQGSRGAGEQGSRGDGISRLTPHASRFTVYGLRFTPSLRPAAWAALAFALAILAGHPQTVLYIFYLSLAYALFLGLHKWPRKRANQNINQKEPSTLPIFHPSNLPIFRSFLLWLFIILLGSLIAAAQILPTLEFISRSLRADLSYQAVSAGLPLNELISILYPGFFGGSPEYVGIVALVLIALALTVAWPRLKKPAQLGDTIAHVQSLHPPTSTRGVQSPISSAPLLPCPPAPHLFFWTAAALISLLLAFGGSTFLYALFYLLLPGFDAVRQQERAFLIYSFSAAILAGYGAMILTGPLPKSIRPYYTLFERRLRSVALFFLGLTVIFIYGATTATARGDEVNLFLGVLRHHLFGLIVLAGLLIWLALRPRRWLRRPWGMGILALWTAFNLFTINWRFNLQEPDEPPPFTPNNVVQFLQSNQPTLRLRPSSSSGNVSGQASQSLHLSPARIASGGLLPGGNSAASVYKLQDLTGNTPLQLAAVDTFFQRMPSWRMWQLMNVSYVIDNRDIASDGLSLVFEEGEVKVFKMGDPFPRAWFVSQVEVISEEGQAMARLASDDFDLRRAAIVATPLVASLADSTAAKIDLVHFTPTALRAKTETTGHHLLIFSQIYDPGWQAKIDNQPVELKRVNIVQQGIVVPAGDHTVQIRFMPASFWWGTILSVVGLAIWLITITLNPLKRYL